MHLPHLINRCNFRNFSHDIIYPTCTSTFALLVSLGRGRFRTKSKVAARSFGTCTARRDVLELAPDILNNITEVRADCSSRRRGNLAEGCNSRRGCFSATRIGSGERRDESRGMVRRGSGATRIALVTSARAFSQLHRPWQFRQARG